MVCNNQVSILHCFRNAVLPVTTFQSKAISLPVAFKLIHLSIRLKTFKWQLMYYFLFVNKRILEKICYILRDIVLIKVSIKWPSRPLKVIWRSFVTALFDILHVIHSDFSFALHVGLFLLPLYWHLFVNWAFYVTANGCEQSLNSNIQQ